MGELVGAAAPRNQHGLHLNAPKKKEKKTDAGLPCSVERNERTGKKKGRLSSVGIPVSIKEKERKRK